MQDLHAAIALYTHGVITKDELREIASVYYKVPLGKTTTTPNIPYINTQPYVYQPGQTWPNTAPVISTVTTSKPMTFTNAQQGTQFQDVSAQAATIVGEHLEGRPTKCACKH
jgi:hypothetical protein